MDRFRSNISIFQSTSLSVFDARIIICSFLAFCAVGLYQRLRSYASSSLPYPPGPKGIPILGNALQVPLKTPWIKFTEWAAVYGDMFYLRILGRDVIVLNSSKVAYDLLHKRSAIYSDRPGMALTRDFGGWDFSIVIDPYGDHFHIKRKFMNQSLNPSATRRIYPMMADNAKLFMQGLLREPTQFQTLNRMYAGANILMLTYGHQETDHELVGWLPHFVWGSRFSDLMKRMKAATYQASAVPYNAIKQKFLNGTSLPCMATTLLEDNTKPNGIVEHEFAILGSLASTYIAGADTTVATLDTFAIAMIYYPEVQREAQRLIDELLHGERLPTFDDREDLPYVEAIFQEVLRWKPIVPGGVPHRSTEDDVYQGMFIPKGTMVIFNVSAMMTNSRDFPNPSEFNPGRFLYTLRADIAKPEDIAFGFGRRICPGRHFADAWVWLAMINMLALFEISPEIGLDGKPILPDLEYEEGLVRCENLDI
ncbi:cytochrome P450 [Sistotremastrum niveocremeum HHB9708]|uniref:Cytochrome P450 n=1 Tax=Sistotremastrum niveocremeum HHB9708 TaxID=1314777 RepID=A0A164VD12_9AGAM|nr:cytochrome P450 [Sistotremastrum niveocremeum HHB9708]